MKRRIRCEESLCLSKHWQIAWDALYLPGNCVLWKTETTSRGLLCRPLPPIAQWSWKSWVQSHTPLLPYSVWLHHSHSLTGWIQELPCQRMCASWRYWTYSDCLNFSVRPRIRTLSFPVQPRVSENAIRSSKEPHITKEPAGQFHIAKSLHKFQGRNHSSRTVIPNTSFFSILMSFYCDYKSQ